MGAALIYKNSLSVILKNKYRVSKGVITPLAGG